MTASIAIDWERETATAEWGGGVYALRCHRYPGARPVYEYTTPAGEVMRIGSFRQGIRALYDRMMRECE